MPSGHALIVLADASVTLFMFRNRLEVPTMPTKSAAGSAKFSRRSPLLGPHRISWLFLRNNLAADFCLCHCRQVQVFRTDNFSKIATIPVGKLPHGIWPSGDGTRIYVGDENGDRLVAIDTLTNKVIATSPIGEASQAILYVPNAVPEGNGTQGLQPLGTAGNATHLSLVPPGHGKYNDTNAPTSISLFDQGLVQMLQAEVTGLQPNHPYVLALPQS